VCACGYYGCQRCGKAQNQRQDYFHQLLFSSPTYLLFGRQDSFAMENTAVKGHRA
jgi:hypothetical protein